MSYVYINREIYPNQLVQDDPLDDNYAKGYSYDDYINGNPAPWIELGEEQLAFKEANPKATVKEIIEAKLDDSRLLNEEKSAKYEEIRTYENNNLHEFFLDDQNIYIPEYDRRNALADGAIAGKITIMGLKFDMTEGKILIGMMDKYDNDLMSALGAKQREVSLATTVEQVRAIDAQSGYPDKVNITMTYVRQQAKEKDVSDPQKVAVRFSRMVVNNKTISLSPNEKLDVKVLFPIWGQEGAEFGLSVDAIYLSMASQKFGFVTVDPVSGSGDQAVNFSGEKHTGRLQRTINLTVTTNGGAKKALVVNQAAAAEVVRSDSPNASVQKTGGNVTITGKSNSTKLTFAVTPAEENGLTLQLPANYTAAGKTTANGAVIADDPGAAGEFVWSITISDVPANVTIEELTATLKVTAAGGQIANVTVTQAAGDSTIELDKETINLDVNGTQQTVNVTSNDSWTWAQAAARTVLRMMGR